MTRIEPNFTHSAFFSGALSMVYESDEPEYGPPTRVPHHSHPSAIQGEHRWGTKPCIFTITPPSGDERWRCSFSRDGAPSVDFILSVTHFSSLAMMLLEALRRLESERRISLEVRDPSGQWIDWLTTSPRSGLSLKNNVPVHILS